MEKIINYAVRNRFLVITGFLTASLAGFQGLRSLTIDAVPDITPVQVQVLTKAPALAPLEVEQFITYPVEAAMSGLPNLQEIRSTSRYGLSAVTIIFEEGVDRYFARQLVNERLGEAIDAIPAEMGKPAMGPLTTGLGEIYQFIVKGQGYSPMELRTLLDWEIAFRLRAVPGVVEVNAWGGLAKQYEVVVNPQELIAHQLTLEKIIAAVEQNNANAGSGYIERNQEQYIIRGEALVEDVRDLEEVVVDRGERGSPIFLKQIAEIREGGMLRIGGATANGEGETVIGMVQMLAGENAQQVVRRVKQKLEGIQKSLPDGVEIHPYYDRAKFVTRVLQTVTTNLVEGGLLVVAVLFLFLGSFRGGLLVALAIPLSMLFAFGGMYIAGISGNLMSLGAIDFGLIVDGSVVMIENIMRRRRGEGSSQAAVAATVGGREVARPVFFAIVIITVVYIPVLSLTGTEGIMFRPMASTIIFALVGSLGVALLLMPALASVVLGSPKKNREEKPESNHETWLVRNVRRLYGPLLSLTIRHRFLTFSAAAIVFAFSLGLGTQLGTEFLPKLDEGDLVINAWRLPSISLSESLASTTRLERLLRRFPEVEEVVSRTGSPEVATDVMGIELSDVFVNLRPRSEWKTALTKAELIEKMSEAIERELPAIGVSFTQPIEMRFNELIAGIRSDVGAEIFGPDLNQLEDLGATVLSVLSTIPGASDLRAEQVSGLPMVRIVVNRRELARYGINAAAILETVEATRVGHKAGLIFEGNRRFPLIVRFDDSVSRDLDSLAAIPVDDPEGRVIPLGQVADLSYSTGPAQVSRSQVQRRLVVEANVRGRDLGSFVQEAQRRIAKEVELPPGYFIEWGGEFENLERALSRLIVVVPAALILIFVLLYMALGSARLSLLIFLNVPLALSGGILALLLRQMHFSISAAVGFVALFGVAVLNGVVLVSHMKQTLLKEKGADLDSVAVRAAHARLRPVLMTATVASLGFIPMALSQGMGAEVQRPLATVVIGGLVTSTLLTLLVIPAVFRWFAGGLAKSPQD